MTQDSSKNLSEKLFAKNLQAKETSILTPYLPSSLTQLEQKPQYPWYRNNRRLQWAWQGLDPIDQEQVLARITSSKHERSKDEWLDTVTGYRSGNWAYEWTQLGVEYQKKAAKLNGDEAAEWLFKASLSFSVAGYPHLKGDNLAIQAQLLASHAYMEAAEISSHWHKKIEVPYEGRTIQCHLHLPHTEKPLPVVLVSAGLDSLQTDLWRFYRDYLAPYNIGMLTVDMPSVGQNSHWELTQNTSVLHQEVLNYLPNLPWIDHFKVGLLGFRFGGNALVRLSFLEPKKIKACVAIGAPVHDVLSSPQKVASMSKMYLDVLASRLGKGAVDIGSLSSQMMAWSLKVQGILSSRRTTVPILAMSMEGDPVSPHSDNQLIATYSQYGKAQKISSKELFKGYAESLDLAAKWLQEELNR
ncbi:esterase FrsA [Vibrio ulleungensis]|uniref:Esterase FrsA n=1 Tax=Vibrio ulleungensis TaxID=2807619 RepID=A0ABS2HKU5_9VIBR|nr:esterase FrsA [Vibrio ulleungensis]MBM7038118.1 esterase FrsA [Vibrio ulleungensis]